MSFRKTLNGVAQGEILVPLLRTVLFSPTFKGFDIKVDGFAPRPPDGWFHPSTHPTWPARLLYYYLTADLVPEPFDIHSTMAVTQGHFWHSFIEHVGIEYGILQDPGECPCGCGKREWYYEDRKLGSRGHTDGLTAEKVTGDPEVFEFKTTRPMKFQKLPRTGPSDPELLEAYARLYPDYYYQGQEYMRLSGYVRHRTIILSMEYPFEMREIVMVRDHAVMAEVAEKYEAVRQAVADARPPIPCCAPKSKESKACPARLVCPIAIGVAS